MFLIIKKSFHLNHVHAFTMHTPSQIATTCAHKTARNRRNAAVVLRFTPQPTTPPKRVGFETTCEEIFEGNLSKSCEITKSSDTRRANICTVSISSKMICENDIQLYFEYVLELVRKSGQELLEAEDIDVEMKNNKHYDLVTQFDTKIEEILIKAIKTKFPDHKFIGEESAAASDKRPVLSDDPTWIIDPIDGTSNFARKIPITCISVGLVIDKIQIIGIIYNPYLNEMFTAIRGQGAYLNGKRIHVSDETEMKRSIFNYELSLAISKKKRDLYMRRLPYLLDNISGFRSFGCAALGLCYVAEGIIDAYQCDGLYPWDAAAGTLIVAEAGGYVCDTSKERLGEKMDLMNPNFLATASEKLAQQFVKWERIADSTANNNN